VRAAPSAAMDAGLARLINQPAPVPGQAFDNLYYVGSAWVSAWVLKTSEGLILIDALNNTKEAADLIEGGMRRLGLDPAQIRYVLVTHGHGDHYGGAQMIADRYRARVVASEIDWKMMETGLEFDSKLWDRPPKRDMAVHDGDTLTLGDTTVRFLITPGHTLGTISPVFDVRHGGKVHKAMIWGGTVVQLRPRHGAPGRLHRANRAHAPARGAMGHRCALEQPPGLRRHGGQAQGAGSRPGGRQPVCQRSAGRRSGHARAQHLRACAEGALPARRRRWSRGGVCVHAWCA
jgi:glyoxylase-like metal-dependent hydrolase (beta-lactamase superfamily II)